MLFANEGLIAYLLSSRSNVVEFRISSCSVMVPIQTDSINRKPSDRSSRGKFFHSGTVWTKGVAERESQTLGRGGTAQFTHEMHSNVIGSRCRPKNLYQLTQLLEKKVSVRIC